MWQGELGYVYVFDRLLTPNEIQSLADHPFQILQPQPIWLPDRTLIPQSKQWQSSDGFMNVPGKGNQWHS
jgi:hypothetical protein